MKITFVVQTFDKIDRGGVLRVVSYLANYFIQYYEVEIISFGVVSERAYRLEDKVVLISLNLEKYNTGFYSGFKKIAWFGKAFELIKPYMLSSTVWITSSPPLSLLFAYMKFFNKDIKVIGCDHTSTVYRKGFFTQKIRNLLLSKNDVMVGLNPQDTTYYLKNGIHSICIPNGIDLYNTRRESFEKKFLIYVGRFNEEKQPFKAIDIFINSSLASRGIIMKMYGHGEYEDEVREYIEENCYGDKVKIIKGETDPEVIYKDALALILTSRLEGFPLLLLEAISRNIPCLSFKTPYGPLNIIREKVNGFFINEDGSDFDEKLELLSQVDRRNIYKSISDFDNSNVLKLWSGLFEDMLNND